MEYYLGVTKEQGITDQEIGAVQAVVMAVSAGRVNAQLREAEKQVKKAARAGCSGSNCE
jgi:hypothetical protein